MNNTELARNFNEALQYYFNEPTNKKYQRDLVWAAFHIYEYADNKYKKEHPGFEGFVAADDYMPEVADIVHQAQLNTIYISEDKAQEIQRVIAGLSRSKDARNNKAFHVVNLAYEHYLKKNLISAQEDRVRSQLFKLREQISQLKDNEAFEKMNNTGYLLETIVNEHFSFPQDEQKERYSSFVDTMKDILNDSKQAVESTLYLKTMAYNLIAAVLGLGIFYGIYLYKTRENRSTFFLETKDSVALKAATTDVLKTLDEHVTPEQASITEEPSTRASK